MDGKFNKQEFIENLKETYKFKNEKFADLRSDPLKNASQGRDDALIQYNPMIDNIRIGAFTSTTIESDGIDWKLRLLTAEEYKSLRLEILKAMTADNCFEEWEIDYLTTTKFLARALTPSPFKLDGGVFNERELNQIPLEVLTKVYKEWLYFISMATKDSEGWTKEQTEALINLLKKKLVLLEELPRSSLLTAVKYYSTLCEHLEKTLNVGSTN